MLAYFASVYNKKCRRSTIDNKEFELNERFVFQSKLVRSRSLDDGMC